MANMISLFRWCNVKVLYVEEIHKTKIASRWPAPLKLSKSGLLVFVVLSFLAVAMNVHVRASQYAAWYETPGYASVDSAYLFSTTDAPYFLRLAGALKRGESITEFESLLGYPDSKRLREKFPEKFVDDSPPLLSKAIAFLSLTDRPADLLRIGNQLVLICAGITALLIIITFSATGYCLPGVVAAGGFRSVISLSYTQFCWAHRHRHAKSWASLYNIRCSHNGWTFGNFAWCAFLVHQFWRSRQIVSLLV